MSAVQQVVSALAERFRQSFSVSRRLYDQAKEIFPGGVTHDLRYLTPFPIYIDRADGAYKWSVDGHQLIDFWSGHGSIILGHSHPKVVKAVQMQMAKSTHPGACHELEIAWGALVKKLVPSAEKVRFTSSGTEATLMALRLSRIFTGKPKVLKFSGHFHGWHDFLVPGADAPYDTTTVPGIPSEIAGDTVIIPPNDPALLESTLEKDPAIGCVILEPTGGHWGAVPIRGAFLKALRDITQQKHRLLIFDEVITGFRVSPGGAQKHYGITPDLTTLAKILAGGLPGGCLAGRADVLAFLEYRPGKAKMKHPGTFNANPLSAAAGVATLEEIATGQPTEMANASGKAVREKLNRMFEIREFDWICYGEFSGFRLLPRYQGPRPTSDDFIPYEGSLDKLDGAKDAKLTHAFRQGMLLNGVDISGLAGMTTAAHTEADLDHAVNAVAATVELLKKEAIV